MASSAGVVLAAVGLGATLLVPPATASATRTPPAPADNVPAMAVSWGSNAVGQLGIGVPCGDQSGSICVSPSPRRVVGGQQSPTLRGVRAVSGGTAHTLALLPGGRVVGWGNDDQGQLGDGTNVPERTRPVSVVGPNGTGRLTGISAVDAGNVHSVGLDRSGEVWAWGHNIWGQLGTGASDGPDLPDR